MGRSDLGHYNLGALKPDTSSLHIAVNLIKLWMLKVCFKHESTLKQVDTDCLCSLG